MNRFRNIYIKIEQFSKDKPFLFWLITLFLTSIPFISFWKQFNLFLNGDFSFKGYELLIIILAPFAIYGISKVLKPRFIQQQILKDLESIKARLDNSFDIEKVTFSNVKYTEKYYHHEIIECFDDYNKIVIQLKKKWPNKHKNLKTREDKPKVGKDWVHYSLMQVIKSDVMSLIEQLK